MGREARGRDGLCAGAESVLGTLGEWRCSARRRAPQLGLHVVLRLVAEDLLRLGQVPAHAAVGRHAVREQEAAALGGQRRDERAREDVRKVAVGEPHRAVPLVEERDVAQRVRVALVLCATGTHGRRTC
eukprot:6213052-Pleurochrysis_carterae.AAC.1